MRKAAIDTIRDSAIRNKNVFLVTGDAGFGVLDDFRQNFPDRFLNLGVAEQNMIGFSAGLAMAGYKVFIYNIIPFLLYRCYEQVRNDICYQELPVTLIGIGSGVTYAPQGVTHYSVEDIAIARTLPNLTILSPCDPVEAAAAAKYALNSSGPVYIRIAKSGEPVIHKREPADIREPSIIRKGKGVAILFHGSVGIEVIKAIERIEDDITVISVPMVQPLGLKSLFKHLKGVRTIITVEEHFTEGGLGSIISDWITKDGLGFELIKLGIKNEFIHSIKNNAGMRDKYGISCKHIESTIRKALKNG